MLAEDVYEFIEKNIDKINAKISETAEAAVVRTKEVALSGVPCYPDGSE